mmetsp:Transcript_6455/g.9468  ORF Transcript_6455/g.9468 Transcript_6455/m.9468 type:complete len:119 (-) Transcript_6455:73-429(-)
MSYCFPNMALNAAFLFEVVLGLAAIYIAFMQNAFDTAAVPVQYIAMAVSSLVVISVIEELRKALFRYLEANSMCHWCLDNDDERDVSSDSEGDYSSSSYGSSSEDESDAVDHKKPLLC